MQTRFAPPGAPGACSFCRKTRTAVLNAMRFAVRKPPLTVTIPTTMTTTRALSTQGSEAAPTPRPIEVPTSSSSVDYIYEQKPEQLLGSLLPKYVKGQIYRALLESIAAEHAARMTAMDAASSNASDMIDKLTLYMNRVRQASITREIIEIVSGAAALD